MIDRDTPISPADIAEICTGERIVNIHLGEILWLDFMEPMGLLADRSGLTVEQIDGVVACTHPITEAINDGLRRAFGMSPGFWLGLQKRYDAEELKPLTESLEKLRDRAHAMGRQDVASLVDTAVTAAREGQ